MKQGGNEMHYVVRSSRVAAALCLAVAMAAGVILGLYDARSAEAQTTGDPVLVGAGDISRCDLNTDEATAKLLDGIAGTVFTAGDNAYNSGTDAQFKNCYDPTWGRHKARTKPSVGNHEYNVAGASGYFNYFGTAAGDPTKGYYSYNVGAWHVVVLNSLPEDRARPRGAAGADRGRREGRRREQDPSRTGRGERRLVAAADGVSRRDTTRGRDDVRG